jgi:hypothetical protein
LAVISVLTLIPGAFSPIDVTASVAGWQALFSGPREYGLSA